MTSHAHARQRGMTLIEIVIVIAIFALMVGMVLVGFTTSRQGEVISSVNSVANVARYGYDKARVNGQYYRLLINIDERSFTLQAGDDKMYLPATDRDGKIAEYDASKEEERAERDKRAADAYNRSIQAEIFDGAGGSGGLDGAYDPYAAKEKQVPRRKPPLFDGFDDENALEGLSKPVKLPEGVRITSVRTADDLAPIIEGEASIFFFPRGRTQEAHIQIEDSESDAKWTIKFAPLTGRIEIVEGHEDLVLPDDPSDEEDELGKRTTRRSF